MRDAISKLPDGEYKYSMETDGFDERFHYTVTVKIKGDEIESDFNGTSDQQPRGINSVMAYTSAMQCHAMKYLLLQYLAKNEGLFSTICSVAQEGSQHKLKSTLEIGAGVRTGLL